jgi:methyl-accepting chemotaxis protein
MEAAELVATSAIYRDINLTVAQYRGHVREYAASDNDETAEMAVKEGIALHELIAKGLARISNPERHGLLESMAKQGEAYTSGFAHVHEVNREHVKLETEVLDVVGQQMTDGFAVVLAGATKAGSNDLVPLVVEGRRLSLLARLDVNKRLARHDETAARSAEQQFDELKRTVAQLDTATKGGELNATVLSETKLIDGYQSTFQRAAALDNEQIALVNGVMRQAGDAMAAADVKAKDSNFAAQAAMEQDMLAIVSHGNTLVMVLGLAGLAVGVVLAWLIGRGISHPVVRMCEAMRALAGGDRTVEIPGVGRKDEIGQMADTVAVFRDSMVEAERLREDNERHKAEAEAERKAGMIRLADTFEAGIKGVVNSVASQATMKCTACGLRVC